MQSLIGPIDDSFALFATAIGSGSYSVVAWPQVAGVSGEFCIPAARLMRFLAKRWKHTERLGPSAHPDVFVHSLTEAEIRTLTVPAAQNVQPVELTRRAA